MRTVVRIDPTLCRGHAICALYLADEVEIDQWGFARVVDPVVRTRRALRRAGRAVAACPNGAVVLHVDDGPDGPAVPVGLGPVRERSRADGRGNGHRAG